MNRATDGLATERNINKLLNRYSIYSKKNRKQDKRFGIESRYYRKFRHFINVHKSDNSGSPPRLPQPEAV